MRDNEKDSIVKSENAHLRGDTNFLEKLLDNMVSLMKKLFDIDYSNL